MSSSSYGTSSSGVDRTPVSDEDLRVVGLVLAKMLDGLEPDVRLSVVGHLKLAREAVGSLNVLRLVFGEAVGTARKGKSS